MKNYLKNWKYKEILLNIYKNKRIHSVKKFMLVKKLKGIISYQRSNF